MHVQKNYDYPNIHDTYMGSSESGLFVLILNSKAFLHCRIKSSLPLSIVLAYLIFMFNAELRSLY